MLILKSLQIRLESDFSSAIFEVAAIIVDDLVVVALSYRSYILRPCSGSLLEAWGMLNRINCLLSALR